MEHHRHHLRAELNHLPQKTELAAFVGQALAQYIAALGVRAQVIQLGLVSRSKVVKKGRCTHVLVSIQSHFKECF